MKVAVVHYWLVGMRGGERVLEEILRLLPQAVVITHVCDREKISKKILKHEIRETLIAKMPGAGTHYQKYLPLMPFALEQMDMSEFDLVISSESGPAKGIVCRPDALHICYCHSPMRYIWDQMHEYGRSAGRFTRWFMPLLSHRLKIWDVTSSHRVDHFIANSKFVAKRIEKYYRRESSVIHPPVAVEEFKPLPAVDVGDHYLLAGELVAYKQPHLAIEAFTKSGRKLTVVGDGPMRAALEKQAGSNITFLGKIPFSELKHQFATCRALIFPGVEDFGIIPVEVMASGRPVVALGQGGALDTVVDGVTGKLFHIPTAEALNEAVNDIEAGLLNRLSPAGLRAHACQFSRTNFRSHFVQHLIAAGVPANAIEGNYDHLESA